MTNENLAKAKRNYQKLLNDREVYRKRKDEFLEISDDSKIQEYIHLEGWKYFAKRVLELEKDGKIEKYLRLIEESNDFEDYIDNDLVEFSFDNIIKEEESDNIYVYIDSFDIINGRRFNPLVKEQAGFHIYKDLETMKDKVVTREELGTFKNNHKIIVFKSKKHRPIELFYRYRIMYLRQFLLGNGERLFNHKKLVKELKVNDNSD